MASAILTPRWEQLRPHAGQRAYWDSPHRFNVVPAARRSGKSEMAKRKLVMRAYLGSEFRHSRYFAAAPTRDQAKTIFWNDLVALVPKADLRDIRLTELAILLTNGSEIRVVGMDKPERIEGSPWDGGILDEYGNMKAEAWTVHVLPALADRHGWCDMIGTPEGRNHYFDLYQKAVADMQEFGAKSDWGAYTWHTSTVLDEAEVAFAKANLDEREFRQEYEGSFETFAGVVLYAFTREHSVRPCPYRPGLPVHIGMDFNINPMSATVWQLDDDDDGIAYQVGEVVIPTSNTDDMSAEIIRRYGEPHNITIYPDPAGAQRRTSAQGKTDITILREHGFRVLSMNSHPLVRDRHNVTNARFCTADGTRRAFVDPSCRKSIESYEKHSYKEGTSEPDKGDGYDHLVDATGYMMFVRWGVQKTTSEPLRL